MISPILATEDPYEAKQEFLRSGWELLFETPRDSEDKLVCVKIDSVQVRLGSGYPTYISMEAWPFRGAGIDIYIEFESVGFIESVYKNHDDANTAVDELSDKPWGVKGFHAKICGYSFFFAGK